MPRKKANQTVGSSGGGNAPPPWPFDLPERLIPDRLRPDLAAVAAFHQHAAALADPDATTDKARAEAAAALAEARIQLHAAVDNLKVAPVYAALAHTIRRARIPLELFDDLLAAFEQDQRTRHYDTWDRLTDHARRAANPLGRAALLIAGHRPSTEDPAAAPLEEASDNLCTALRLTILWQNARADLLDRDRVFMPAQETRLTPDQLKGLAERPGPDAEVRFSAALRPLVRRTRALYDASADLHRAVDPALAPAVWRLHQTGLRLLDRIEAAGYTTLWKRPELTRADRFRLAAGVKTAARADA